MARGISRLTLVGAALLVASPAFAVPAYRGVVELRQPDGWGFRARLWGDERHHGPETEDGFTIDRDPATGNWHFVKGDGRGSVERLAARPGRDLPPAGLQRGMRPSRQPLERSGALATEDGPVSLPQDVSAPAERVVPPTGTANIPVILVNFSNTTTSFTPASFETLLFSSTYSMAAYYQEVSYGAFSVGS